MILASFNMGAFFSNSVMPILISLLIFGIIVLVHELGHLVAAKKNGVYVEEFAIGMGPKLYGFIKDETMYSIRILPLGGYCKMLGEDGSDGATNPRSFASKKVSQKIVIIVAGVVMNIVLAIILQFFLSAFEIVNLPIVKAVSTEYERNPALEAGIEPGDRILSINGSKIYVYEDVFISLLQSKDKPINLKIKKSDGQILEKNITPFYVEDRDTYIIGFSPVRMRSLFTEIIFNDEKAKADLIENFPKINFGEYVNYSVNQVVFNVRLIYISLKMLAFGEFKVSDMSGPIGIVTVVGETYNENVSKGFWQTILPLVRFAIMLSANLAVINLLPFPALDGGRLIFLIIEGLRGKPIDPEKEGMIHLVGFALLMCLAIFVAYSDIIKLIKN